MIKSAITTKITPPRLNNIVHRERLYKLIGDNSNAPVKWISSPGGYGKTTLISAFIDKRNATHLWYKVDAGDRDIASFFYHLGLAVKHVTGKRTAMPLLKPEYQLGIPAFTRHFFRELYSRLPAGSIIVFDNYQDAGEGSELYNVIHEAIQEIPQGYHLFFISREEPPVDFSRLRANGDIFHVNSSHLEFTLEEIQKVAKLLSINNQQKTTIEKIHSCTKGWITGFKLLFEQENEADETAPYFEKINQNTVFDYFAGEILRNIDPEIKLFLLKTSLLPVITISLAKQLTGHRNAKKILNNLVLKQFFTVRRGRIKPSYEYHPLFREFLIEQLKDSLDKSELHGLNEAAGLSMADAGDYENAIGLLIQSESWGVIISILIKHSKKLIDQGRNAQLSQWIESIPKDRRRNDSWINYWHGMALLQYKNDDAIDKFILAYNIFKNKMDALGLYLSWCGIANSFTYSFDNFTDAIPWLDEFRWLRSTFPKAPTIESKGQVIFSAFSLMQWADPTNKEFGYWIDRMDKLHKYIPNRNIKIAAACNLSLHYAHTGQTEKIKQSLSSLLNFQNENNIPALLSMMIGAHIIICDYTSAEFILTDEDIDAAYLGLSDSGMVLFNDLLLPQCLYHAEHHGNVDRVKFLLDKYKKDLPDNSDLGRSHFHFHAGTYAMMVDDIRQAIHHAEIAVEFSTKGHSLIPEGVCRTLLAYLYAETGQIELAMRELEICETIFTSTSTHAGLIVVLFIHSWISIKQNNKVVLKRNLTKAFDIAHKKNIRSSFLWPHKMVNQLCAYALYENIHPDFVKRIIKTYKYTPGNEASEHWPYPIKIYTLNRFGIIKDNQPLRPSGKVQQFIKALVALGGRDVHEETLSNALWPDAEGDAAHQSFATTLHRVRKLIGSEAIQLRQNLVSLDPCYCWIDIWSFKRTLSEIEKEMVHDNKALLKLTERAIKLYQGPFLGADENSPWMLSTREQLSHKFLRILTSVADTFCQTNECAQALGCYQKGLEIDDLSENVYQGLMRCHSCSGNKAEGLAVYQRCREKLKATFGIEPSQETERLHLALKNS